MFSGGLLLLILLRLDFRQLWIALSQARGGWILVGAAAFGCSVLIGGIRWRIALIASEVVMPSTILFRAVLTGHFFNMILFGPAGGDVAKSTLYSRWYAYPMYRLLAASVVDRTFSVGGSVLFGLLTLGLILASPLLQEVPLTVNHSGFMTIFFLFLLVIIAVAAGKSRFWDFPFFVRFAVSLKETVKRISSQPWKVLSGCLLGLSGQILLSSLLAFCLFSVSETRLPWMDILWVFPLVSTLAALPFTVGGSGVRESVALLLLSRFDIPAVDVVAAGLLTLLLYLFWATIGASVVVWEERHYSIRSGLLPEC